MAQQRYSSRRRSGYWVGYFVLNNQNRYRVSLSLLSGWNLTIEAYKSTTKLNGGNFSPPQQ